MTRGQWRARAFSDGVMTALLAILGLMPAAVSSGVGSGCNGRSPW